MPIKGNGKGLGLTNGTVDVMIARSSSEGYFANRTFTTNSLPTTSSSVVSGLLGNQYVGLNADSSKSGVVGTVTQIQINCNYIIKY